MLLQDEQLKGAIARNWDISSEDYDSHAGHGIKSDEERETWKRLMAGAFPPEARSVLDIGCGTGELSALVAGMGYQVTGIDISPKMLDVAKVKAKARGLAIDFRAGDAEAPPFGDGSFDVVFNRHLLWTLPHPQAALNEWHRVLKSGGRALIVDGVWDDGTLGAKVRRSVSDAGTRVFEGRGPHKGNYSADLRSALPNGRGTPKERTIEYLRNAGFKNITTTDIRHLREIQSKHMSFWARLRRSNYYYLISGEC